MRKKAHCAPSEELYHWGQYYVNINDFSPARSQLIMTSWYCKYIQYNWLWVIMGKSYSYLILERSAFALYFTHGQIIFWNKR